MESKTSKLLDLSIVKERQRKLDAAKIELKKELFGIDSAIDSVIDSIRTWYLVPELITTPVIVSLFGLTGTGKTQLVRSLVKKLNFQQKFIEVQMDGFSEGSNINSDSIYGILVDSMIEENSTGIVLLDEFQRFRTIDENGREKEVKRYQDVWQLLSDGKFPLDSSSISKALDSLAYSLYSQEHDDDDDSDDGDSPILSSKKKDKKYRIYPYEAKSLKKLFNLSEPLLEIMTWDQEKILGLKRKCVEGEIKEPDYSKCLIFVCGNLDEAFRMAGEVNDSDTCADLFYERTLNISSQDIKESLKSRFKPEQISRLGNNIIVYPSLNKAAYQKLIKHHCSSYASRMEGLSGIKINLDDSVFNGIYDNSVYPSQGTRPVFSSINTILGAPLSDMILWGAENELNEITVFLNSECQKITATGLDKTIEMPIKLEIEKLKKLRTKSEKALLAVHEAGHAIIYTHHYLSVPKGISINRVSGPEGSVISESLSITSKKDTMNLIDICVAGRLAEKLVFGEYLCTIGSRQDIKQASSLAAELYRREGFGEDFVYETSSEDGGDEMGVIDDFIESNREIKSMVGYSIQRTDSILAKYSGLLKELSTKLIEKNQLREQEYFEIVSKYISGVKMEATKVSSDYFGLLENFNAE